jgi:hypothetical protein
MALSKAGGCAHEWHCFESVLLQNVGICSQTRFHCPLAKANALNCQKGNPSPRHPAVDVLSPVKKIEHFCY